MRRPQSSPTTSLADTEAACNLAVGEPWGQAEAFQRTTVDVLEPPSLAAREEFKESTRVIGAAFPDFAAALQTHATGLRTGDSVDLAPTGTTVTIESMVFFHIAGGLLTEEWEVTDVAGLLTQLGSGRPAVEAS